MTPIYENAKIMLSKFFKTMLVYSPTIVIRHRRENLKKCSLSGLETRDDIQFYSYPIEQSLNVSGYLMLTLDENVASLSKDDASSGLLLLDATWRLATKMEKHIPDLATLQRRSLPSGFLTAYPRRQQDCPDPQRGLSSLEALAIAYFILNRDMDSLLKHYHWKEKFLFQNKSLWEQYGRTY